MFKGWSRKPLVAMEQFLNLQEGPYETSILKYFFSKAFDAETLFKCSYSQIGDATNISRSKIVEVIQYLTDAGYILCQTNPGQDSVYGLRYSDAAVSLVQSSPKAPVRAESYKDWIVKKVTGFVTDETRTTKLGKPLPPHQRKIGAVMWAFREIFGSETKFDVTTIVEQLACCGGSAVKVARWYLSHANFDFAEDQRVDIVLLQMWKAKAKSYGKAGQERTGLNPQIPVEPKGRQSLLG